MRSVRVRFLVNRSTPGLPDAHAGTGKPGVAEGEDADEKQARPSAQEQAADRSEPEAKLGRIDAPAVSGAGMEPAHERRREPSHGLPRRCPQPLPTRSYTPSPPRSPASAGSWMNPRSDLPRSPNSRFGSSETRRRIYRVRARRATASTIFREKTQRHGMRAIAASSPRSGERLAVTQS